MTKPPRDHEDRLEQQYRRLGTRNPSCMCCNESNPFCLELHHVAGRKHHEDMSIVCRNCHRKLTDQQLDHVPPDVAEASREAAKVGHYLLGLCDLLAMVIETLGKFGKSLINEPKR